MAGKDKDTKKTAEAVETSAKKASPFDEFDKDAALQAADAYLAREQVRVPIHGVQGVPAGFTARWLDLGLAHNSLEVYRAYFRELGFQKVDNPAEHGLFTPYCNHAEIWIGPQEIERKRQAADEKEHAEWRKPRMGGDLAKNAQAVAQHLIRNADGDEALRELLGG